MRTSIICAVSALAASVAALPAVSDVTSRRETPATWTGLSWSVNFGTIDWDSPYSPGENGFIRWTGNWNTFANPGYVTGLPGFAVSVSLSILFLLTIRRSLWPELTPRGIQCTGQFDSKTPTVGVWTLCKGSSNGSTVEGQLISPDGDFRINVRQNVTVDGKTTIVTGTGVAPDYGDSDFTLSVASVETVS